LSHQEEKPFISAPQSRPTISGHLVGGKYRLEERLGEGAVGVVYRAVHVGLEKSFAIKLLKTSGPPALGAVERFRREAVALGRLRHPNIVEVTDFGIDESEGGPPYIVTKLLEGMPLSEFCRDRGPLPLAQALPLLEQIAAAVDAAHDAGILHRDLKPGNVFVCSENPESPDVKVLDFGLAELLERPDQSVFGIVTGGKASLPRLTNTGSLLGTPLYLAPELAQLCQASRSSDIYSFGVLVYEILSGSPPFRGTLEEVLAGHVEAEPPPFPLPPEVWRPLRETLQKDPVLRPGTAGEVVRRFREGMSETDRACRKPTENPLRKPHRGRIQADGFGSHDRPKSIHAVLTELQRHLAPKDRAFVSQLPRERLYAEHRRLVSELARMRAELRRELNVGKRRALHGRLRKLESRIGVLESPFLELTETRADLVPGTVLLTYYVGDSQSFLFVIEAEGTLGVGLFLYPLAIGKEELAREVEAFRNLLGQPNTDLSALKERGRHLYDLLIGPAEPVLGKADRWLILPDGPLHSIPFTTLFSGTRYLADSKPIYIAASRAAQRMSGQAVESRRSALLIAAILVCVALVGTVGFMIGREPEPSRENKSVARANGVAEDKFGGTRPNEVQEPSIPLVESERRPTELSSSIAPEPSIPLVESRQWPAEPPSFPVPVPPSAKFGFNDIQQACGDLSSLTNYLCLVNQGSEPVAGGARLVITEDSASFTYLYIRSISIRIEGKEQYSLRFGPSEGKWLIPGLYTGAGWMAAGPKPEMRVTGGSYRSADGRFHVLEIRLTGNRKVRRFVADFKSGEVIGRISVGDLEPAQAVNFEPRRAEPSSFTAPASLGVTFAFNDIEQACGDLSFSTYLCLVNRGSEQIAGGARLVLTEDLASFTARSSNGISISLIEGKRKNYFLGFGPPEGKVLIPGLYTRATRWPFNRGPYPGIDVSIGGFGCNEEEGQFRILQIRLVGEKVQQFVADFESSCLGAIGRIAVGQGKIELKRHVQ